MFGFIHRVWSAAGQTPLHHSVGSPNLTSEVRSIYVNSVIVVSRNLGRQNLWGGGKTRYFSFHSSSDDKIVKFFRKECASLFLGFWVGYTKFHFYIQPLFLGACVQSTWGKLWLSGRFLPKLCGTWLPWFIPCPDRLVSTSKWTYLSSQAKVNIVSTWAQMLFQLAQSLVIEVILFQLTAMWRRESRCYCPYFMDEKVGAHKGSAFWGSQWRSKFGYSHVFNIWLGGSVLSGFITLHPRACCVEWCLVSAREGHRMNKDLEARGPDPVMLHWGWV